MRIHNYITNVAILVYYLVANKLPSPPFPLGSQSERLRAALGKLIFARCGEKVIIRKNAYFGSGKNIEIGDFSEIGLNAYMTSDVKIGCHVLMGPNVTILSMNHAFEDPERPIHFQGVTERRPVVVEDDVWIGASSILLPGVLIGRGSVIGAGSVVTRSVPPFSVAAGNPARVIRLRGAYKESSKSSRSQSTERG